MSYGIVCRQGGCKNYAFYRFTWPGHKESAICTEHQPKLVSIADAIGLPLQLIPLTDADHENLAHPLAAQVSSATPGEKQ
jgi:hypothetical protein